MTELICWLLDISYLAIPIFPIVEPIQVTSTLPIGKVRVRSKPDCESFVFVSITYLSFPKSAGDAHSFIPLE